MPENHIILNDKQIEFLLKQISDVLKNPGTLYIEEWKAKIEGRGRVLAFILQGIYPSERIKVFQNFVAEYPDLDCNYTQEFLGILKNNNNK